VTVERLQCPSCGAAISAEGRSTLCCSYCGATLRIKTGAAGHPAADRNGTLENTASRTELARVEAELARLERRRQWQLQRSRVEAAPLEAGRGRGCLGLLPVALAAVGVLLALRFFDGKPAQGIFGLALIGVVVWIYARWVQEVEERERRQVRLQDGAARALAETDARVAALRERAEALRAQQRLP
jgi:hypothetical protein